VNPLRRRVWLRRWATLVAIVGGSASIALAWTPLPSDLPDLSAHPSEGRLLELTNAEREATGVDELAPHGALEQAARHHAEEMMRLGYLSHVSPTEGRRTVSDRLAAVGSTLVTVGENLAAVSPNGDDVPERVIEGWLESDSHRENLLAERWTHVGVGLAESSDGRVYAVQLFAFDPNPIEFVNATPGETESLSLRWQIVADEEGWVQMTLADVAAEPVRVSAEEPVDLVLDGVPATKPTHVLLGWAPEPAAALVGQASGWFDPVERTWTVDWVHEEAVARVIDHEATDVVRDVAVHLAFEGPASDLVIFVDRRMAHTEVTGTNVRFPVSGREGVRRIEVGVRLDEGRVQTVHAFDVVIDDDIALRGVTGR
jgi:hypothetical protein